MLFRFYLYLLSSRTSFKGQQPILSVVSLCTSNEYTYFWSF